jgi:hypothetical protein
MGYTHYWTQTRNFTTDEMRDIGDKVRKIIAAAEGMKLPYTDYSGYPKPPRTTEIPVVICGGMGEGDPEITSERVWFNGQGPDYDHETFGFNARRKPDDWGFCKTARKPYDVVVVACLTFLATDYGFEVSSDGDHEELQAGVDLCCQALGKDYAHPLTIEVLR